MRDGCLASGVTFVACLREGSRAEVTWRQRESSGERESVDGRATRRALALASECSNLAWCVEG